MAEFDRHSSTYREQVDRAVRFSGHDTDAFARIKAEHLLRISGRWLGDPAGLQVLDVGCGVGATDAFLAGRFSELHGVDISAESVAIAREHNPGVHYDAHEPGRIPRDDGQFDLTFFICVVHHVPPEDWDEFVAEARRVTRPGGLVVIFEHNPWNPLTRWVVSSCELDEHAVLLRRRRARELFARAGLEVVESRHILTVPFGGLAGRAADRLFGGLPLGAQYYVAARVPAGPDPA